MESPPEPEWFVDLVHDIYVVTKYLLTDDTNVYKVCPGPTCVRVIGPPFIL